MLLGEFGLHARDGCLEKESYKVLVSSFCADLLQGRNIGRTIFEFDDEQGMVGS